ncbi:unnamed protein product (macronuclear) [Paramecium tetraurelia]|uniref:histidine kinase n=1 Tax=Paramecium tetraurelia TaxID=5888 RepID=A0E6Y9_PARTE|nr:uncharacterized protein GSPATT00023784001 [Paramecium tetraurelia]CAK91056.1 unnamed protein product [Paramecium tetraurelia]|eukprot:XP_001458453.1 hypothetical protein (macronuclear) [Paramecium tetraurelia strain d4-2]
MQEQEFLKNENNPFLFKQQKQISRTVLQSLVHEYHILIKGLTNQEYQDYCNVKGACGQTIPLILILPIGLTIGTFQLVLLFFKNIQEGPVIPAVIQFILLQTAQTLIMYMILKACEVIPKKIENPLLFGKITSYIFMCLSIAEGTLIIERISNFNQFSQSQFWSIFGLIIWQKVIQLFIYDCKLRIGIVIFLYIYYVFRLDCDLFNKDIVKVIAYICLEIIFIIDAELKNYSQYQFENNMQFRNNKEDIQFMIPQVQMQTQQQILEIITNQFPVIIFDQTKELLHISGVGLKQLQMEDDSNKIDLISAEIKLRKMEVIQLISNNEKLKHNLVQLKRMAKFGSTCGTNEKGELLHSLINGPALQIITYSKGNLKRITELFIIIQMVFQSNYLIIQQMINSQNTKGISKFQSTQKSNSRYFQFTLIQKYPKGDTFQIILDFRRTLLKSIQDFNFEFRRTEEEDLPIMCQEFRQMLFCQQTVQVPLKLLNVEIKNTLKYSKQQYLQEELLNVNNLVNQLQNKYQNQTNPNIKLQFQINLKQNTGEFKTDQLRLMQIMQILLENSINNTKEGFIKIVIEDDKRQNCIQISVEDTGKGINQEIIQEGFNMNQIRSLHIVNYLTKILGPQFYCKKITGQVANKGIRIKSLQDCGTSISFSIRNLGLDEFSTQFIIDDEVSQDEMDVDVDEDEIMERYIRDDDQIQYLQRFNKGLRSFIINRQQIQKIAKPLDINTNKKQTKLVGMMKLQELGRFKNVQQQNGYCQCNNKLIINSNQDFERVIKQHVLENVYFINEQDSFKHINLKIREKQCQNHSCQVYKQIIVNCHKFDFNYRELINRIIGITNNFKIIVLIYNSNGEIDTLGTYIIMPIQLDMLLQYLQG